MTQPLIIYSKVMNAGVFPHAFLLTPISETSIESILEFFDEFVADGTINGRGKKTWHANLRLEIMRWMLENADRFIKRDKIKRACKALERAYKRCDGENYPPDFVVGESVPELADMIDELMISLECESF